MESASVVPDGKVVLSPIEADLSVMILGNKLYTISIRRSVAGNSMGC